MDKQVTKQDIIEALRSGLVKAEWDGATIILDNEDTVITVMLESLKKLGVGVMVECVDFKGGCAKTCKYKGLCTNNEPPKRFVSLSYLPDKSPCDICAVVACGGNCPVKPEVNHG